MIDPPSTGKLKRKPSSSSSTTPQTPRNKQQKTAPINPGYALSPTSATQTPTQLRMTSGYSTSPYFATTAAETPKKTPITPGMYGLTPPASSPQFMGLKMPLPNQNAQEKVIDLTQTDPGYSSSPPGPITTRTPSKQQRTTNAYATSPLSATQIPYKQKTANTQGGYALSSPASSQPFGSKMPIVSQTNWTEEDDERNAQAEVVDLTQADNVDESAETLGQLDARVVGLRYYNGIATVGEKILLRREPNNQYDRNAIRVDNMAHRQIGHIKRDLAARVAPLMDQGIVTVEGTVAGPQGYYDMDITLEFWGPSSETGRAAAKAAMEQQRLKTKKSAEQRRLEAEEREHKKRVKEAEKVQKKAKKIKLGKGGAPPGKNGNGNDLEIDENGIFMGTQMSSFDKQQELVELKATWEELAGQSAVLDPGAIKSVVSKFGIGEDNLTKMPAARQPAKLATQLLPYQLQGLAWLLQKEHPQVPKDEKDVVQLWKKVPNKSQFQNIATMYTTTDIPTLMSGGILADDMGLGKTIQIISLICSDITEQRELVPHPTVKEGVATAGTLIVAPLSVMSNWTGQMEQHVAAKFKLKAFIYHGPNRHTADLSAYDVVITSYGTLTTEHNPKLTGLSKKGLFSKIWRRVVLDEAHQIRNPKAKAALAATALSSQSRWCLSGTPIVNALKDLYSLLKFMQFPGGLADYDVFNRILIRPLSRKTAPDKDAPKLLQVLMATLCIRRTKDMKFVDLRLPDLTSFVHAVQLSSEERRQYTMLEQEAKGLLKKYVSKDKSESDTYRNLLELLLRMRQCCNHSSLCGARLAALSALSTQDCVDLTPENKTLLQELLQLSIDSQEDCAICFDSLSPDTARITVCKHVFCLPCLTTVIEGQHKCPMCRSHLADLESTTVEPFPPTGLDALTMPPSSADPDATSSKISALVQILVATARKDPGRKTVVFSQWSSFLTLLQPHLTAAGIVYTRLDGTMSTSARDAAIFTLANDAECTVLLASLGVASVGLNLTMASQVVLADPWWAPTIEGQAIDRVYRLGQKKETAVWRLVCKDSIEERVLDVQENKKKLVATAFNEKRKKGGRERLGDIQTLLG